jgi:RimJ/RimL family protein N-acetyltransferase
MATLPVVIDENDFTPLFSGRLRTDGRAYTVGFIGKSNIGAMHRFLTEAVDSLPREDKSFLFKKPRAFFEKLFDPGSESRVIGIICGGRLVGQAIAYQPSPGAKTGMTDIDLPGPPETLSLFQGVCVAPDMRGNDLMGVMAQAWLDHAAASGRKHALAEIDVRNAASWSTLIKRGLNLAGIGFDPNDSSIIYNAHEEIARLPAKRLHGAFNKAARGELYACRTANIEKQQELYRKGYKAIAYNRPQDILIFRRPPKP